MNAEQISSPFRYRGQSSQYVDVALRGTNEHLGISIQYAAHPSNVGCFILRFVAHGTIEPSSFTHLSYREPGNFMSLEDHAKIFKGVRLNKVAIKAFEPAVFRHEVDKFATKFGTWDTLTEWVAEQIVAEGFLITVTDLKSVIRGMVVLKDTPEDTVKSAVEFPDLSAVEHKAPALKLVKADEDEDEDDTDEEDGDDKEWLN